jgi:hypothetical protein
MGKPAGDGCALWHAPCAVPASVLSPLRGRCGSMAARTRGGTAGCVTPSEIGSLGHQNCINPKAKRLVKREVAVRDGYNFFGPEGYCPPRP